MTSSTITSKLRRHWAIIVILALFVALGAVYSIVNPLFESPDEVWHYEYVRWVVEGKGLPRPEEVGTAPWHQEGSQPPLYYLLAAAITSPISTANADEVIRYNPHAIVGQADSFGNKNIMVHSSAEDWPWQGVALAAHVARFFTLLLGVVTVVATYGAALSVFPGRRAIAALAAALVAFNPQFLFLSAAVNNDMLVIAASAGGVWLAVHLLGGKDQPPLWQLILFGVLVGIAATSKLSGLALAGLAGLTFLILAWRNRSVGSLIKWGLIVGGVALVVGGWWYLRNLYLYGDPLGLKAMFDILPRRTEPPTIAELLARAQGVWRSAWAVFGWFNVTAEPWLYSVYTLLSLAGLLGVVILWPIRLWMAKRRLQGNVMSPASWSQIVVMVVWIAVIFLALLSWAQMRYPQGRLLFPAISATAVMLSLGLSHWLPQRFHKVLVTILVAALYILAAIIPFRWIAPSYAAPSKLPASTGIPNQLDAEFGDQIKLVGYSIAESEMVPGSEVHLTLYWQALQTPDKDYSVFIHFTDDIGIIQAQRDSYPASGSLPTSDWQPGDIYADEHLVRIPPTAPAPASYQIDVGLYDFAANMRLQVGAGDAWSLGTVTARPRVSADGIPNPVHYNFDDQIALVGFQFNRRVIHPGDTLALDLWWEASSVPATDYVMFSHLVFPPDAVWAGRDAQPQDGASPTSSWQPGDTLQDQHQLVLPPEAPAGIYFVEIGIYDAKTFDRLPVNFSTEGIILGQIKVESN